MPSPATTRLAPSPTGALHLGNARTFLINYILARHNGWRVLLRIEDLDGPRTKRGADQLAIDDLRWLGIEWDAPPIYQSTRSDAYRAALEQLIARRDAYPCVCTRKEIDLASSAPHLEDGATRYPGTCRDRFESIAAAAAFAGRTPAIRFRVTTTTLEFADLVSGVHRINPERDLGDFVICKNDGLAAYQLAVVVDDHDAGVTHVVRGDDLLDSTPRQMMLYRALGWADAIPQYAHLSLVVGTDGLRLAKRHGDTRLSTYREAGTPAGRVRALVARWSGIDCDEEIGVDEMIRAFRLEQIPREKVIFTDENHRALLGR